ncbi:transcriptional regulator family: Fungal Specific TF [Penicillium lividum]|nr:transcriptional regulator family: Fungal Specific TF [Penicillium lividum]
MEAEAERLQEIVRLPSSEHTPPSSHPFATNEQICRTSPPVTHTVSTLEYPQDQGNVPRRGPGLSIDYSPSHYAQEPISNPLALLADASDAARALEPHSNPAKDIPHSIGGASGQVENFAGGGLGHLLRRPGYVSLGLQLSRQSMEHALDALLTPTHNVDRYSNYFKKPVEEPLRDVGPDVDPVDLGLITMEEAYYLFPIYFTRLHPMNGILDPALHTPDFVRSRSALLFTWVLALTAQFDHVSASFAKRLRLHGEKLSQHVHTCGFKSAEIVQGYYISLLSATPAETLAKERSWLYTMHAFGVAAELGLDQYSDTRESRAALPLPSYQQDRSVPSFLSQADAIGNQVSPQCEEDIYNQRLIRNRERTWFRILLWERANSAACGRIHSFPETALTKNIERWWMHPLADPTDRHTSAFIALRRILASLNSDLRDKGEAHHSDPHWVRDLIDNTLQPWCSTWLGNPATGASCSTEQLSNTYLRYVYLHGRLWTLSIALNNSKDQSGNQVGIRNDCFEAAINACEVAVHDLEAIGEPLYGMLAPTWAMISYAAVLALKLFPAIYGSRVGSQLELFALLSQVALQLERAGQTPSHRFGIAALLGQHIMMILRAKARALREELDIESSYPQNCNNDQQIAQDEATGPFISDYDPFLTNGGLVGDVTEEGFADLFREIFGPGFGGVF